MTSFHVICGLGLHQSKILGTPMIEDRLKKIFKELFLSKKRFIQKLIQNLSKKR